jgi:hypothetical protein
MENRYFVNGDSKPPTISPIYLGKPATQVIARLDPKLRKLFFG